MQDHILPVSSTLLQKHAVVVQWDDECNVVHVSLHLLLQILWHWNYAYTMTYVQNNMVFLYIVPSISIGTVKTKSLCWLWSQDIYKWLKDVYEKKTTEWAVVA